MNMISVTCFFLKGKQIKFSCAQAPRHDGVLVCEDKNPRTLGRGTRRRYMYSFIL